MKTVQKRTHLPLSCSKFLEWPIHRIIGSRREHCLVLGLMHLMNLPLHHHHSLTMTLWNLSVATVSPLRTFLPCSPLRMVAFHFFPVNRKQLSPVTCMMLMYRIQIKLCLFLAQLDMLPPLPGHPLPLHGTTQVVLPTQINWNLATPPISKSED